MTSTLKLPGTNLRLAQGKWVEDQLPIYRDDGILDPPWCGAVDLVAIDSAASNFCPWPESTPILIAGKEGSADDDAQRLALRVLSSPFAALSPLLQLDPTIEFSPDQWMLECIWFPYQTYRACWYANFVTEYDGRLNFAFTARNDGTTCDSVEFLHWFMDAANAAGYCQESFAGVPPVVSWIVGELRKLDLASDKFKQILVRIDKERLFGTELVAPLMSVLEESKDRLPESEFKLWRKRLQRCASAIAAPGTL